MSEIEANMRSTVVRSLMLMFLIVNCPIETPHANIVMIGVRFKASPTKYEIQGNRMTIPKSVDECDSP